MSHTLLKKMQDWTVEPSDQYGNFYIARVAEMTDGSDACQEIDQKVACLLQAAPDLFLACQRMLEWVEQARHGTLNDMECAMEREVPDDLMREAMRQAALSHKLTVCANCETTYLWSRLDPIDDLRQRVEPGEILPAGQCPVCSALCYFPDENEPDTA